MDSRCLGWLAPDNMSGGRSSSSSGSGADGKTSSVGEVISCFEEWLPPALRCASDKAKLFDSIASLYRQQDEQRLLAHQRYRQTVQAYHKAKHPELFCYKEETFLVPSLLRMLRDGSAAAIRRTVCAHGPLLYSFDMLQPRICSLLLDEVQHFEKWLQQTNLKKSPPNSLSSNGVVLDDFGFSSVLDMLMKHCVAPLVPVLFPQLGSAPLDSHHGFVVTHCPNLEPSIGCHVDNSEVTLNISLCSALEGGDLYFKGVRCIQHLNETERDLLKVQREHASSDDVPHVV